MKTEVKSPKKWLLGVHFQLMPVNLQFLTYKRLKKLTTI